MALTQPAADTTTSTTSPLIAYFSDPADAQSAVNALQEAGFTSAHLGLAHRGDTTASSTGHAAGQKAEGMWDKVKNLFEPGTAAEPYADERQSGDFASHEITPGYDNTEFGGTLSDISGSDQRSRYFGHRFSTNERATIVTVNAPGRREEAEAILTRYGADLGDAAADYDYSSANATTDNTTTTGTQNIQLLGEVLRVHKDRINRGEVTFRKEVITDVQTVQVPVTREKLVIERHAATGSTPTGEIGQSGEIRIPLTEERASLDKSTVVREEVSVGKRAVEEVRDLSGETRREELVVDDTTSSTGSTGSDFKR